MIRTSCTTTAGCNASASKGCTGRIQLFERALASPPYATAKT